MEGKKAIIGIAGLKGSGKDTVGTMIHYILCHNHGNCKYAEWLTQRHLIEQEKSIVHFADTLKEVSSILLGIPVEKFNDRDCKDKLLYNFYSRKFVENKPPYYEVTLDELHLCDGTLMLDVTNTVKCIKLRTFLQWFATEVCREKVGKDIWIYSTLPKISETLDKYGFCSVADVRFKDEVKALKCCSLYRGGIYVKRDSCVPDGHISEGYIPEDYTVIENNGSLMQLFYKVYDYIQTLLKQ